MSLIQEEFPQIAPDTLFDATAWFDRHGGKARYYYKAFTMLLIRHAILLETFEMSGFELQFTRKILIPAMQDVMLAFGVKPLIARIEDAESEGDEYWLNYPGYLRAKVAERLPGRSQMQASA